ncbi:Acyl-CoA reductase [Micromonospora phaseoli]|uniref:Acyl-CoA reductase n=1 Tax=Micromonospora phaseoli TaxID=1144548 RepID=A0A1H6YGF1_9ACTN|nr:aldehyde dehydrogenase family protein [Micromonospora phaseoli]PZW00130.1 acyl-CoA reductase-like NAD-dependent aldehyde dehydrogenase [Micromonospora phaseoli]GIJ78837.1 betaine-aldehyde dehydrogenase [Micromonospora phaseoli]SEJ38924.1 Acyl-CoA reductase [Micromonospora phaseoli]
MPVTAAPTELIPDTGVLIGATRTASTTGGVHHHVYPGDGRATAAVPLGGEAEMDAAVRAAGTALVGWRATAGNVRRDLLLHLAELVERHATELSGLQTLENGCPRQFASVMPTVAVDHLRYNAGWADKIGGAVVPTWPVRAVDYTLDEPYGVVAVIIPWNGPLVSVAQMLAPALAAGNTVVLKPSELAPFTALRLGELALEAGFPPGVVNVVPGGAAGGAALVRHPGVDKVHFTGGGVTARKILADAAERLLPVGLELGGKSAHIIFGDADVRMAARLAMTGVVALSGQGCANGTRVLAHSSVYDEVLRTLAARLARVPLGDPADERTLMGPVVSESACHRILAVVERARDQGDGRLVTGGVRLGGDLGDGYFIAPTVFAEVDPASELAQEEIFGPVLAVTAFDTEEEAIRLANGTRYGLGAYLHTTDLRTAHRVSRAVAAGSVWVNGVPGVLPSAPFGGVRQSGWGRIGGEAGVREFLRPKNVWIAT